MTRAAVFVASVSVLCLTVSVDARAEPIRITGGSLEFPEHPGGFTPFGVLSVVGNRGFSLDGFVDSSELFVGPLRGCGPCVGPLTIPAGAGIFPGGTEFTKPVTLDGQTYTDVNGMLSDTYVFLELSGTIDIPPWRDAPVTISAPFGATGGFRNSVPGSVFAVPIGRSGGTLTMNLVSEPGGTWFPGAFRYDFVAMPTPEPATLTLVTGGLVAQRDSREKAARPENRVFSCQRAHRGPNSPRVRYTLSNIARTH